MNNKLNIKPAKGEPTHLAGQLEQAFSQIGFTMMSDEFAAKLLAYVYVMGGGNEAVVYHKSMNADIHIAQQKANLYGGSIPNLEMIPLINKYIKELEKSMDSCPWLSEIFNKYKFIPPNTKKKKK